MTDTPKVRFDNSIIADKKDNSAYDTFLAPELEAAADKAKNSKTSADPNSGAPKDPQAVEDEKKAKKEAEEKKKEGEEEKKDEKTEEKKEETKVVKKRRKMKRPKKRKRKPRLRRKKRKRERILMKRRRKRKKRRRMKRKLLLLKLEKIHLRLHPLKVHQVPQLVSMFTHSVHLQLTHMLKSKVLELKNQLTVFNINQLSCQLVSIHHHQRMHQNLPIDKKLEVKV
jgi:hypothetical protein